MADDETMKTVLLKQNRALYVLLGLFLLPVLAAHYVFSHANHWVSNKASNYGQFVNRPMVWQTGDHPRPWQLAFKVESVCRQDCLDALDKLSRLRLSMGRKLYDLDLVLVFSSTHKPSPELQAQLDNQNILWALLSDDEGLKWAKVFKDQKIILFGPEHQAVLKYPKLFQSKKMAHDLQLLIK
ncbi:MAG: hypothetical protein EBY16_00980 [Gammaproteobacteria bacterium]|nr:hypothetical protein [Gammaproteobacteria bacterium]